MRKVLIALIVCGLAIMIAIALSSCSSTKHVNKTETSIDSSYIKELEQKIHVLTNEIESLHTKISELQYTGVVFDNDCDSILKAALLRSGCNADSINAVLAFYKSKVKFYADGAFEVEGNLKTLTRSKTKLEEIINSKQRTIDSLSELKSKVETKYQTVKATKEVEKKKGFPWLIAIVSYALGIVTIILLGIWIAKRAEDDDPIDKIRLQHNKV